MVYLFGVIGFFVGFAFGLMLLYVLLRHRSNRELLTDDSLKLKFGLLNWALAALGAYLFVQLYHQYQQLSM